MKKEPIKGTLQTNCYTARALGVLLGSIFGGVTYSKLGGLIVFRICAILPFIMSIGVWNLERYDVPKSSTRDTFDEVISNLKQQKMLQFYFELV